MLLMEPATMKQNELKQQKEVKLLLNSFVLRLLDKTSEIILVSCEL